LHESALLQRDVVYSTLQERHQCATAGHRRFRIFYFSAFLTQFLSIRILRSIMRCDDRHIGRVLHHIREHLHNVLIHLCDARQPRNSQDILFLALLSTLSTCARLVNHGYHHVDIHTQRSLAR